jgi:hypothetical protein
MTLLQRPTPGAAGYSELVASADLPYPGARWSAAAPIRHRRTMSEVVRHLGWMPRRDPHWEPYLPLYPRGGYQRTSLFFVRGATYHGIGDCPTWTISRWEGREGQSAGSRLTCLLTGGGVPAIVGFRLGSSRRQHNVLDNGLRSVRFCSPHRLANRWYSASTSAKSRRKGPSASSFRLVTAAAHRTASAGEAVKRRER